MKRKTRGRRRTVMVLVPAVAVLAVGAATATAFGFNPGWRSGQPADDGAKQPLETAEVKRQNLVATESKSGSLGYGEVHDLATRLDGTITSLPKAGATIDRGATVCQIDDTPVVLLYGSLPAYRDLSPGVTGDDVEQFEKNLAKLGYQWFTVDDTYDADTADAVRQWQSDLGLPQTGTVELGRVVYAAGKIRIDSRQLAVGELAQSGTPILGYTGKAKLITVTLDISDQDLVAVDDEVAVTLPDGGTATGKVSDIQIVVKPAETEDGDPKTVLEVSVEVDEADALAGLDQASLSVTFAGEERPDVLTVPVGALLALPEGGYGVEAVDDKGTRIIPVTTGLFASGRVEVSGDGITEGMTVGMPS